MMSNHEEAEDMLQESFAEAFLKLNTFRFESTFGAWLKRITINRCINELKKRRISLVAEDNISDKSSGDMPDEEITGLSVEMIRLAMQKLPEGYRVVFSLYLLEGYDHGEISQILGISEATSKSQYCRAKNRIKELLTKRTHAG